MRIEITDREMWMAKINSILAWTKSVRDERNAAIEARWLQGSSGYLWWRRPNVGKPPRDNDWPRTYPSSFGWSIDPDLNRIGNALLTQGTGSVFLSGAELTLITNTYSEATE